LIIVIAFDASITVKDKIVTAVTRTIITYRFRVTGAFIKCYYARFSYVSIDVA